MSKTVKDDLADALCVIGALCDHVSLNPPHSFVWATKRWKKAEPKLARLLKKYPHGIKLHQRRG
jgi:ADP-ribosylglycohydrolase